MTRTTRKSVRVRIERLRLVGDGAVIDSTNWSFFFARWNEEGKGNRRSIGEIVGTWSRRKRCRRISSSVNVRHGLRWLIFLWRSISDIPFNAEWQCDRNVWYSINIYIPWRATQLIITLARPHIWGKLHSLSTFFKFFNYSLVLESQQNSIL